LNRRWNCTLASSGSNTSIRVGVCTSIGIRYKILANSSIGMLLWGSMAICAREGFGTFNEASAFIAISESIRGGRGGGSISWDATIVDGGSG